MSYMRDICNLLETSQICHEINDLKESNASIDVIGRLISVLGLPATGSTILDHLNAEVNGQCCDRCRIAAQAQLAERFCDVMVMLRTLVVNAWLIEFALRLGPSRLFDPGNERHRTMKNIFNGYPNSSKASPSSVHTLLVRVVSQILSRTIISSGFKLQFTQHMTSTFEVRVFIPKHISCILNGIRFCDVLSVVVVVVVVSPRYGC